MNTKILLLSLCALFALNACEPSAKNDSRPAAIADIPEDAVDPLSHMSALETGGHKGQIHFHDGSESQWFGSIANLIMYTRLPETANRPMTAYVSLSDTEGKALSPWQWTALEDTWFVLLPPNPEDPFSLATWTAYREQSNAEAVVQNVPLSRLYRYHEIRDEDLLDCH